MTNTMLLVLVVLGALAMIFLNRKGSGGYSGPAFPVVDLMQGNVAFDIPSAGGSLNYVTAPTGPLTGKTMIRMKYRLDLAPGATLKPLSDTEAPTIISLYFQRAGDDWTAVGQYEAYRWYAAFANLCPIPEGEHTLEAPLDGAWSAIMTSTRATNPDGFQGAIDHAERVGFVLGGGTGLGHGVFATGPAKLTVLSFEVI
jgi:hypothetical protein